MNDLQERLRSNYYQEKHNASYRAYKGDKANGLEGHGDRQKNWAEDAAIRAEFKADLEDEYGVAKAITEDRVTRKKADLLFAKAWDYGHSAGYREVDIHYGELLELVL